MQLEKIYARPLDENEQIFKKAYFNSDKALWATPMSYSQYEKYLEEGLLPSPKLDLYKNKSVDRLGNTVEDIILPAKIDVTLHRRYGYPVLHNHKYIEIIYVATGNCSNHFKNTSFHMKEGDLCIMAPNTYHTLSCTNDESCILNIMVSKNFIDQSFFYILRGGELMTAFFQEILYQRATNPYILFPTGKDKWLQHLARRILTEEIHQPHAYDYSIALLTSEFLLHVVRNYEVMAIVPDKISAMPNDFIVAVLGYLNVNYNRTSLTETASFFGYSPSALSRKIHDNTGKTYHTIITELQMEHAKTLLKSGETDLTKIAHTIGCFDSSHFNKKFKAAYGMTPRQYVKTLHYAKEDND